MEEKISGGSARALQLLLVVFFSPIIYVLLFLVLPRNLTVTGVFSIFFFFALIAIFLYISFSYGDIYKAGKYLIIKKIFVIKKKEISEIKEIDRAIVPFSYFIEFKDKYKVYFSSDLKSVPNQFFSNDPDKWLKAFKLDIFKQGDNNLQGSE